MDVLQTISEITGHTVDFLQTMDVDGIVELVVDAMHDRKMRCNEIRALVQKIRGTSPPSSIPMDTTSMVRRRILTPQQPIVRMAPHPPHIW